MLVKKTQMKDYFSRCLELSAKVDKTRVPRHAAVIMDGNGRWARARGWKRFLGHENAREAVREAMRASGEIGIEVLSLFAFSTENWARPKEEVEFLFHLFERVLAEEVGEMNQNNVRLRFCGERERLPDWFVRRLDECIELCRDNTGLILNLAVNYGGKQDILQAVNRLRELRVEDESRVGEEEFAKYLLTGDLPQVDLLIRTSSEYRISNFFLWQTAYAELVFLKVLWPDFRREHLLEAVIEYQRRDRRFGNVV